MLRMTDFKLSGKRVLIREDFNVPMQDGQISDDSRIRAALPTIKKALDARARVILVSHLGRPKEGEFDPALSLSPVAKRLSELLGQEVPLIGNWIDGVTVDEGQAVLCENVRFLAGEKKDDDDLARKLGALCQVYINDAFATAHRTEASTHGVAKYARCAGAGLLLTAEVDALRQALLQPARPLIAVVGGAKVSTKLQILEALAKKVDRLIVGGGIANTFLAAAGKPIGKSLHEPDLIETARRLMQAAAQRGSEIPLPSDVVCAKTFSADAAASVKTVDTVEADDLILDVGPDTARRYASLLQAAGTIVWNGPLGVFEYDAFAQGSKTLAEAIAGSKAFSIAGGGETVAAIAKFGVTDRISYISTAGGAFLEYLEGRTLPAIAILEERARAQPSTVHPCEGY